MAVSEARLLVRARVLLLAAVTLGAAAACGAEPSATPTASAVRSVTLLPPSASAASLVFGPTWQKAKDSGDPADALSLAAREGASRLLGALDDPTWGPTALSALPYADDSDLALGPLAARAAATGNVSFVDAINAIVERPPRIGERLDPEGESAAVRDLLALARDASKPVGVRARAVTALRRFSARGLIKETEIPTDLDAAQP
jgi:hypothetical protein